jgi:hypothetical protein
VNFASIRRTAIITMLVAALATLFGGAGSAVAAPAQPAPVPAVATPVTGTFTDAAGGTGTASGTFTPTQFLVEGDQVLAQGVANLTMTDSAGQQVGSAAPTVALPVVPSQAGCQILDLVLGPLDLDLLGLVVHLDRVHLNITAEPGPGNLLGNLLCAVANLLNGPSPDLRALTDLLNAILALLNS